MAQHNYRWPIMSVAALVAACGGAPPSTPSSTAAPAAETRAELPHGVGVVQSIDAETGTLTIAHQPIESLGWPAMTMPFKVAKPELLQRTTVGENVEFTLDGKDMSAKIVALAEAR